MVKNTTFELSPRLKVIISCSHCSEIWEAIHLGLKGLPLDAQIETLRQTYIAQFSQRLTGHAIGTECLNIQVIEGLPNDEPHQPIKVR